MTKKEIFKRYILFVISLFFIGLGIGFTKHGNMGISPVSSVANVLSIRFEFMSFGTWLFTTNCLFLLGQIVLLRKKFQPIQLLQIPLSMIFGYFSDFGVWIVSGLPNGKYALCLLWVMCGIVVVGFGVSLSVIAEVILNSSEALIKAIADTFHKDFGNMKVLFDVSWVIVATCLSLIFFHGLEGVREGTILSAVCIGLVVKFIKPRITPTLTKLLKK